MKQWRLCWSLVGEWAERWGYVFSAAAAADSMVITAANTIAKELWEASSYLSGGFSPVVIRLNWREKKKSLNTITLSRVSWRWLCDADVLTSRMYRCVLSPRAVFWGCWQLHYDVWTILFNTVKRKWRRATNNTNIWRKTASSRNHLNHNHHYQTVVFSPLSVVLFKTLRSPCSGMNVYCKLQCKIYILNFLNFFYRLV